MRSTIGVLLFFVLFFSSWFNHALCNAETEITANFGYHIWSESGHTFPSSDVHDKEWNDWAIQAEGTYWWNQVGVYVYGGFDFPVEAEMFPNWYFKSRARYAGIGGKARLEVTKDLMIYLGGGVNYTHLENEYGNGRSDVFDDTGPDIVTGANYYFGKHSFLTLNGRYTFNEMNSKVFG